jgi:hypothetical protein
MGVRNGPNPLIFVGKSRVNLQRITVFLFVRGTANSEIETLVARAQMAAALDTLERLVALEHIGEVVVATANPSFGEQAAALGARVDMDSPGDEFHFGRRLAALVSKYRAQVPLYVGGGSGVLMRSEEWRDLVQIILNNPGTVAVNNLYSSDFAAWSPGTALERIPLPELDNDLAFRLAEHAGLRVHALPKNAATQLDIDTPTDLLTIAFHPALGRNLSAFLRQAHLETSRVSSLLAHVSDRQATALIAGRVSASMALFLERETRCQWRVYSEERGMRASGRERRGDVRSLLGSYLDQVGIRPFFATLGQLGQAALIDSRVLFAHRGLRPSAQDRFSSDLLQPAGITDPFIRAFTEEAREAPLTMLLGGHSLVSGGMYALIESRR